MANYAGSTTSLWLAEVRPLELEPLAEDVIADACVVGAGIAGITAAYLLARDGLSVVVLDDGPVGGGMTCRTSAHLCDALDDRYHELERLHGGDGARLAAASHGAAIDRIGRLVVEEAIDCDFERVDGYLFAAEEHGPEELGREFEAASRAGLEVALVDRSPFEHWSGPALRFPRQGQFHPLRYLAGLTRACLARGGRIYTGSHAARFQGGSDARVATSDGHMVRTRSIVVATNSPVNDRVAMHTKQHAYVTYVVALRVPRDSVPRALAWDTCDPYHYVRLHRPADDPEHDVLLVGGADHRTGQSNDGALRLIQLERWARERFPVAGLVLEGWSGQILEPVDSLGYAGRNPMDEVNVYLVTGDSGNGLTHGTLGAMIVADLVAGRANPWAELYDPARKRLRAATDYVRENVNVAGQYADWVTGGDVASPDQIPPGEGAVIRRGATKVACWRRPDGACVERSAICPHLRGVLAWNSLEKTWDCPAHGSRFAADGTVLQGPANSDMSEAPAEKPRKRAKERSGG